MSKFDAGNSLTYKSKFLFFRHNQEAIHVKINVSVLLDVVVHPYQLIKITFDREIRDLPGNGFQT